MYYSDVHVESPLGRELARQEIDGLERLAATVQSYDPQDRCGFAAILTSALHHGLHAGPAGRRLLRLARHHRPLGGVQERARRPFAQGDRRGDPHHDRGGCPSVAQPAGGGGVGDGGLVVSDRSPNSRQGSTRQAPALTLSVARCACSGGAPVPVAQTLRVWSTDATWVVLAKAATSTDGVPAPPEARAARPGGERSAPARSWIGAARRPG